MYSFHQFKVLSAERRLEQLSQHGIALDLAYSIRTAEAVLFAYNDFYVELLVVKYTDDILSLKCFKRLQKLDPFLPQIDISEITALLACSGSGK